MRGGPGIYETMDTEGGLGNTAGQGQKDRSEESLGIF